MNKYSSKNLGNLPKYSTKSVICELLPEKGSQVLDVGCNDGFFGRVKKGNVYYGIDKSLEALEEAKKYYAGTAYYDLNVLERLPWDKKFDVIIFADVLEHVLEPEKVLKFFVSNYLNETGFVIVSLPNIANWQVRVNLLFGRFEYTDTGIMDNTHLRFYTFKTALDLVKGLGFSDIRVLFGSNIFGPLIKTIPLLRNILSTNIILLCKL